MNPRCPDAMNNSGINPQGSESPSPPQKPHFVVELRPEDVLLGRGHKIINYDGNKAFRELVKSRKEEYVGACRHQVKDDIAREIYNEIIKKNGRFLRRITTADEAKRLGVPKNVTAWIVVDEAVALEKTKQTLRDKESSSRAQADLDELEEIDSICKPDNSLWHWNANQYATTTNQQIASLDNARIPRSDLNLSLQHLLVQNYKERILSGGLLHGGGSNRLQGTSDRLSLLQSQRQLVAMQQQQQQRIPQQTILSSLLGEQLSKDSYAGLHLQNLFAQLDSRRSLSVVQNPQALVAQQQQIAPNKSILQSLGGQSISNIQNLTGMQKASLLSRFSGNNAGLSDLLTRSQNLQNDRINTLQINSSARVPSLESSDVASMLRVSSLGVGNRALLDLPSSMAQVKESLSSVESDDKNDRKRSAVDFGEQTDSSNHDSKRKR